MNCLLDTCALLWLTSDPRKLPSQVRAVLSAPGAQVCVSAVSAWELGLKTVKGKLALPKPLADWFPAVCRRYALEEIPVTSALAIHAVELPPLHSDPFDRLLIATAQARSLTLLTPDSVIHRYPDLKCLWTD